MSVGLEQVTRVIKMALLHAASFELVLHVRLLGNEFAFWFWKEVTSKWTRQGPHFWAPRSVHLHPQCDSIEQNATRVDTNREVHFICSTCNNSWTTSDLFISNHPSETGGSILAQKSISLSSINWKGCLWKFFWPDRHIMSGLPSIPMMWRQNGRNWPSPPSQIRNERKWLQHFSPPCDQLQLRPSKMAAGANVWKSGAPTRILGDGISRDCQFIKKVTPIWSPLCPQAFDPNLSPAESSSGACLSKNSVLATGVLWLRKVMARYCLKYEVFRIQGLKLNNSRKT